MFRQGFDDALQGKQDQKLWTNPYYRDGWFAGTHHAECSARSKARFAAVN